MNYFEFFDIPVSFRVDTSALRRQYLENSKKYHPDFHTLAGDEVQADMLEMSTLNNEAYKTLLDPDRRMRYILEINGLLGEEESQPALSQDFLMEMMEINEALMELEFDFDQTRYDAAMAALVQQEKQLLDLVQPVLDSWKEADGKAALAPVLDYYLKKRYLLRIRENLSKFAAANEQG
ncbi:MAG: Fe-S protein assembly co-chaperone HscB [Saprospiraceae bacterium]|nr:Fe-S protein assembly co-chaperone HscB [Saprospiraceae bacterium]